jgi:hypothetical protein
MLVHQTPVIAASTPKRSISSMKAPHATAASGSTSQRPCWRSRPSANSPATRKPTTSGAAIQSRRVSSLRIRNSSSSASPASVDVTGSPAT